MQAGHQRSQDPRRVLPTPGRLLNLFKECSEAKKWDEAEKVLRMYWPNRFATLLRYLQDSHGLLEDPSTYMFIHRAQVPLQKQHRFGLNMNAEQFQEVKYHLTDLRQNTLPLDDFERMLFRFSPYVVIYACMDLDIPLPRGFDCWFFWCHLSELLEKDRAGDLFWPEGRYDPMLADDDVQTDEGVHALTALRCLIDTDGVLDIDRILAHSGPSIHLYQNESWTAGAWTIDPGTPQTFTKTFCLSRPESSEEHAPTREQYAMLDAACCWGSFWSGKTVQFTTSSQRLAWAINDSIDSLIEFPAVQLLQALGERWRFRISAISYLPSVTPDAVKELESLASQGTHAFSHTRGLVLELLDTVLLSANVANALVGKDLLSVVLESYGLVLMEQQAAGYTGARGSPGRLYTEMRRKQLTLPEPVAVTDGTIFLESDRPSPAAHTPGSSHKPNPLMRFGRRQRPTTYGFPRPVGIQKTKGKGPERPRAVREAELKERIQEVLDKFRTDTARREERVRRARGNAIRLAAAHDDSSDGMFIMLPPELHYWSGSLV